MRARRTTARLIATALAAVLLALPALPAFALEPVVASGVTIAGVSLAGMNAEEASAAIATAAAVSTLANLPAEADGHAFSLDPDAYLTLNVAGLVTDALAAAPDTAVPTRYFPNTTAVAAFVTNTIAHAVDRGYVNSVRRVSHRKLTITASSDGARVDQSAATMALTSAMQFETPGGSVTTVTVPWTLLKAHVTRSNIGKTIIVVRGLYRVRLYNGAKLEKSYICAVGMGAYPTPLGKFKVVRKSPHPTWNNPGSGWARGMPSHIGPGFYNPLGLRALYLSAPGIRIHGTAKSYSMGHRASHGCIRLTNHNVVDIYPRVKVGTPVYIVR